MLIVLHAYTTVAGPYYSSSLYPVQALWWIPQSRQSASLFLQSSELGHPHPLTRRRVCSPLLWFRGSLVGVGMGESQFRQGDRHYGSLGIQYRYVLCGESGSKLRSTVLDDYNVPIFTVQKIKIFLIKKFHYKVFIFRPLRMTFKAQENSSALLREHNFSIKTLDPEFDPDPQRPKMLDPDPHRFHTNLNTLLIITSCCSRQFRIFRNRTPIRIR